MMRLDVERVISRLWRLIMDLLLTWDDMVWNNCLVSTAVGCTVLHCTL